MIRKLSLAVAIAAALSPFVANALGLGEIQTKSVLNQEFKADIELLSIDKGEIQGVKVELGSAKDFERAGIERSLMLSGLRFEPVILSDGRAVIRVTSGAPVREPFLNFLVEVNWPKGRLIREYTVLLDPPVILKRKPTPVAAPTVTRRLPVQPASAAGEGARQVVEEGAREYGPIARNDYLWRIASKMRRSGETTEQVMMALLRYNPNAFIGNNVNRLKAGKILRLPADANVQALSHREAREEFLAQTSAWRAKSAKAKSAAADAASTSEGAAQEIASTAAKPKPKQDRIKLISAKPDAQEAVDREGKAAAAKKIDELQKQVLLMRETNESTRQEGEEMRARIHELESQLVDIQRLLTLKSDQLAQLQLAQQEAAEEARRAAEAAREKAEALAAAVSEPEAVKPAVSAPESAMPEVAQPEMVVIPPGTHIEEVDIEASIEAAMKDAVATKPVAPAAEVVPPQTVMPETIAPAEMEPTVVVEPQAPVVESKPQAVSEVAVAPEATAEPEKPETKGLIEVMGGNTTVVAGLVGGVAVLLLGVMALAMRRRKEAEAEFEESILIVPEADASSPSAAEMGDGPVNEPTDETSFMSDFTPSDIDALQDETGEVDPISEADVYIAYGRYQQAEELIKQAIEKSPERLELKEKLLEIHYSAKDTTAFNEAAVAMHQEGIAESDTDSWKKIARMGRELDPENVLYESALDSDEEVSAGDEMDDLGLELESGFTDSSRLESIPSAIISSDRPAPDGETEIDLDSMEIGELKDFSETISIDSEALGVSEMAAPEEVSREEAAPQTVTESQALGSVPGLDVAEADSSLARELEAAVEEMQAESVVGLAVDTETLDIDLDTLDLDELDADDSTQIELPHDLSDQLNKLDQMGGAGDDTSELSNLDLSAAMTDSADTGDSLTLGDDSESLDDLDLASLERELESLSDDLDNEENGSESFESSSAFGEADDSIAPISLTFDEGIELGGEDEVNTKMDLARAYLDMGDEEGAKNLLDEVIAEGSSVQKQAAQSLLGQLS
ncbi:FimV/HubP family polar landmark protein [endosymbiont of Ridgeia piscesae]|jgi:pilus assembly protein FimV|uniref:FimV N-terminal domain n=1 Tax=endosymbiont of Ridgeia piscesae TaxID=54398 RepID=A0A0T5YXA9_9GAMM|nr:FimV/HubP family polar landmark protein [endosymbiont of Ridgeia piscesae]KRT54773.1 FimV N-terminal domain [endosymbiont of Ridgeia piscesae]KRT59707.1 pilus assembly protein FimV [endosymbiont of Ridgeia piscesae]